MRAKFILAFLAVLWASFACAQGASRSSGNIGITTPGPTYDPIANGVVCDGVTDNASAMNTLVTTANGAATKASPSRIIMGPQALPCMLDSPINMKRNVYLVNEPPRTATWKITGTNSTIFPLLRTDNLSNVIVGGFILDGNVTDQTGVGGAFNRTSLVRIFQSNNIVFNNVKVQNTYSNGISMDNAVSYSGVVNSEFVNIANYWRTTGLFIDCGFGVLPQQVVAGFGLSKGNFVKGNYAHDGVCLGLTQPVNEVNFVASDNICIEATTTTQFFDVTPHGGAACVALLGGTDNLVLRNYAEKQSGNCFDLNGITNLVVMNNSSINCGIIGIYNGTGANFAGTIITPHTNLTIEYNTVFNGGQNQSGNQGGLVFGNAVPGNANVMNNVLIQNNIFSDNQQTPTQNYGIARLDTGSGLPNMANVTESNDTMTGNKLGVYLNFPP